MTVGNVQVAGKPRSADGPAILEQHRVLKIEFDTLKYALSEGHFEVVKGFHVSHALLCRWLFLDFLMLEAAAHRILEHFKMGKGQKLDAIVTATACGA